MKKHWKYWLMGAICAMAVPVNAQVTLVKKQKPMARICVVGETEADKQAAALLQDFVGRISQANLPIVNGGSLVLRPPLTAILSKKVSLHWMQRFSWILSESFLTTIS